MDLFPRARRAVLVGFLNSWLIDFTLDIDSTNHALLITEVVRNIPRLCDLRGVLSYFNLSSWIQAMPLHSYVQMRSASMVIGLGVSMFFRPTDVIVARETVKMFARLVQIQTRSNLCPALHDRAFALEELL